MRSGVFLLLLLVGGCGHRSYFEGNVGSAPSCQASKTQAGRYRCEGWALVERSRANGPEGPRLARDATLRFQVADALDNRSMSPEQAASVVEAGALPRAAAR